MLSRRYFLHLKKNTCKKIINMTIPKLKAPDIGDIIKTLKINMGVSV